MNYGMGAVIFPAKTAEEPEVSVARIFDGSPRVLSEIKNKPKSLNRERWRLLIDTD